VNLPVLEKTKEKHKSSKSKARATAGRRQPAVELEHIDPDDALENVLKVLVEQHKHKHKRPRRIVLTHWLSSVEAIKVVVTHRPAGLHIRIFFRLKLQTRAQTFMSGSWITVYLGGTGTTAC
jgi:hypothetical protein